MDKNERGYGVSSTQLLKTSLLLWDNVYVTQDLRDALKAKATQTLATKG